MRLHWAPRVKGPARQGPRAVMIGQFVYFCQMLPSHENCRKAYNSY